MRLPSRTSTLPPSRAIRRCASSRASRATCAIPLTGLPIFGCLPTVNCDWFAQDCPSGGNCRPVDTAGTTTCDTAGTGVDGDPCSGAGAVACARGFACISQATDGGSTGACRAVCDPTLAAGDDAGATPDGGVSRWCPTGRMFGRVNGQPSNYGVCVP